MVVAVQDGADWLQGFIDFHRRDAVRVLDFPHAVEYLTRASHEALGAGAAATSDWIGQQAHALKHDGPKPVLTALRALPGGEHRDAALGYLEPRLAQLQYPAFRAAGYPIGSGIVEGANKVVVEDRLKGSGMHWAPASVDPLLAPRTVMCANRWDEAWPQISARLRADQRLRHAVERRSARAAALRSATPPSDRAAPPPPVA
ncbi:MAG: ISKra4 family transposase, partial [Chloroflexota bacterium]|nr:ISKra4 family transposase [Chloroflexota bacterium]